jgi:ABC-type uncharacterized transport system fused permease/ATPase subunit
MTDQPPQPLTQSPEDKLTSYFLSPESDAKPDRPDETTQKMHFWRRFFRILRYAHPSPRFLGLNGSLWLVFIIAACVGLNVLINSQYGLIRGNFSQGIIDQDMDELIHASWHGIIFATLYGAITALMMMLQYFLQATCRYWLTKALLEKYLSATNVFYKIASFEKRPVNPDQRLTQDCNLFTDAWAEVIAKSIDTPIQIIYYNVYAFIDIGWIGMRCSS